MREMKIKLYEFNELDTESRVRAIENHVIDLGWDRDILDDAKLLGMEIERYDLYFDKSLTLINNLKIQDFRKLLGNQDINPELYQILLKYNILWDNLVYRNSNKIDTEFTSPDHEANFNIESNKLDEDFNLDIEQYWKNVLTNQYALITSNNYIMEYFIENGIEFKINGKVYETS